MTACKDLKERILNDPKYVAALKEQQEEQRRYEEKRKWMDEIESWFLELPVGRYIMYNRRSWYRTQIYSITVDYKYQWGSAMNDEKKVDMWDVKFAGYNNLKWLIENKEQVCKEIEFIE